MSRGASIAKLNDTGINEDAFCAADRCIAVSDGAGGCGLFADEWSRYLIEHLPKEKPICSFAELDGWVDGIWEPFYNEHEEVAKRGDGIFLNKYYNEGSCATIAVAWRVSDEECRWMAYGDSVVFHYDRATGRLEHSFTRLADFSRPPRLVSCKDPLEEAGFRCGTFRTSPSSVVFAASDALSHYVLMMYELSRVREYGEELAEEYKSQSGNSQLLKTAEKSAVDFDKDVIDELVQCAGSEEALKSLVAELTVLGVLDADDYTLVML